MEVIYTQFYNCSGRVRGRVMAKAGDRLWLNMYQSSKLEAVTDSLFIWHTVLPNIYIFPLTELPENESYSGHGDTEQGLISGIVSDWVDKF